MFIKQKFYFPNLCISDDKPILSFRLDIMWNKFYITWPDQYFVSQWQAFNHQIKKMKTGCDKYTQQLVTACHKLLQLVTACQTFHNLSQLVTNCQTCHNLSQLVLNCQTCHNLSQLVTNCHKFSNLLQIVTNCHKLSQIVTNCQNLCHPGQSRQICAVDRIWEKNAW